MGPKVPCVFLSPVDAVCTPDDGIEIMDIPKGANGEGDDLAPASGCGTYSKSLQAGEERLPCLEAPTFTLVGQNFGEAKPQVIIRSRGTLPSSDPDTNCMDKLPHMDTIYTGNSGEDNSTSILTLESQESVQKRAATLGDEYFFADSCCIIATTVLQLFYRLDLEPATLP